MVLFNHCLLRYASYKKLIFSNIFKIFALFEKSICISEKDCNSVIGICAAAMVNEAVKIIRITVVLHWEYPVLHIIFVQVENHL